MFVFVSSFFINHFTPKNIAGITIFPFIIVEKKEIKLNKSFINHEKIHIRQQAELLLILFILIYYVEFFILWIQYRDAQKAYKLISFEREAYDNESNLDYLKTRKWYAFTKYWRNASEIEK